MNKPESIKFKMQSFTDDEIEALLESTNWRSMRPSHRNNILSDMANGDWETATGETIGFDEDGRLVNGQHRLSAAQIYQRNTGDKVWFWCAHNVAPRAAEKIDTGLKRSITDWLNKQGVSYASNMATIVRADVILSKDKSLKFDAVLGGFGGQNKTPPSISRMIDRFTRFKGKMSEWGPIAKNVGAAGLSKPNMLGAIGYQLSLVDEMDAKLFFSYLTEGSGLALGDPILALREKLIIDAKGSSTNNLPRVTVAALVIKAWGLWRTGDPVNVLRWTPFGRAAEEFPDHRIYPSMDASR